MYLIYKVFKLLPLIVPETALNNFNTSFITPFNDQHSPLLDFIQSH